jgi:mevalonate kinase
MSELRVPGKLFLMGEYGVLFGGQSLILTLKPGYLFQRSDQPSHPDSPLGVYCREHSIKIGLELDPASSMLPGFGSSTAELLAGLMSLDQELPASDSIWSWYRKHFVKASGADLVAQLRALIKKTGFFKVSFNDGIQDLPNSDLFEQIFLFQAPTKIPTHVALDRALPKLAIEKINGWVQAVEQSLSESKENQLDALNSFAEYISSVGLESESAKSVRQAFIGLPQVLSAKGCGALLNDVFVVAVRKDYLGTENQFSTIEALLGIANQFDLRLMGTLSECVWS